MSLTHLLNFSGAMKSTSNPEGSEIETDHPTIHRRRLLSIIGGGIGVSNIQSVSLESKDEDINTRIGTQLFAELAITYKGIHDRYPTASVDSVPNYVIERDRLHLFGAPIEIFSNNSGVIVVNGDFNDIPTVTGAYNTRSLPLRTDFRGVTIESAVAETDIRHPTVQIKQEKNTVKLSSEGESITVTQNNEATLELSAREVEIRPKSSEFEKIPNEREKGPEEVIVNVPEEPQTVEVSPVLSIRNRGKIPVHGVKDGFVFPIPSSDPYASIIINNVMSDPRYADRINKNDDILVVREE